MSQTELFIRFGASIAIGFLIGLQREFSKGGKKKYLAAGERTFALFGLVGALGAMVSDEMKSGTALIVVLLIGIFLVVSYALTAIEGRVGLTTEVAALITVLIGSMCYWGNVTLAVAVGISTTVLLSLKVETDRFVSALTREDILAALKLAVLSTIVLSVLPNQSVLDVPFDILNPFKIWLMVVFIAGIGFLVYIAIKLVGPERSIGLTRFFGGLVSSTAVTLSFLGRSKNKIDLAKPLALAMMISWTVMFPRILIEVGVLHPRLLTIVWVPFVSAGIISLVLLVSRTAQHYLGTTGLLISSIVSGLVDVDAIALSVAELSKTGGLDLETGSRAIVFAAKSKTMVKGGIALVIGSLALRKVLLPEILLILTVGLSFAFFV